MALLEVRDLRVRFETHRDATHRDVVHAVDGVTFDLEEGQTLGLVGESGSGKSVTNLALLGMIPSPPGVVEADAVRFEGENLLTLSAARMRRLRGNQIAMIFQDPMTSLNPFLTVGRQMTEVLETHLAISGDDARQRCAAGLGDVGIPNPEARLDVYPHELSGGMRQRVMIAMALLCKPKILLADEPTTALDVTIQAQILELMKSLQEKHGTAIILVTHDLGVVAGMADRVNVMYAGRLVESADTDSLFEKPLHPYSQGLMRSVTTLDGDPNKPLFSIEGQPPDLTQLPKGCSFHPRCSFVTERCLGRKPHFGVIQLPEGEPTRRAACFEAEHFLHGRPGLTDGGSA